MTNNLKKVRELNSLTQEQLANLVSVSRQSIISIEKGHYVPTTILALKIASVLKLGVESIFVLEKRDWH
ncbi:MAG: helix-turn-helix transcriptional regulator [Bacteroidetes bacterium]|nr:helix-turn-helix transcriptional regulator [Bacteroidota bacterium]